MVLKDLKDAHMKKVLFRSLTPLFATVLVLSSSSMVNAAPDPSAPSPAGNDETSLEDFSESLQLSKDPTERRRQLTEAGFVKVNDRIEHGYTVETYSKKDPSGITVEYDVVVPPAGPTLYVNFEWDWGPRLYMTGAEFWSLGAAGFAGLLCNYFSGGLAAAGCSMATTAFWNKLAGNNRILNDQTCYDFSQALNIGWEVAPKEKCR